MVLLVMLVVLLGTSVAPGHARGGGHGGGHGHHGGRHSHHGGGDSHHGFLGPRFGVSIWPYWDPYVDPYGTPPVVVAPPSIYIQPAPPLWYYCDNPQGYYP